jgi:outer membrane lipoprotein SlyB
MTKLLLSCAITVAAALGGCAARTPAFDEAFGRAVETAKSQQTIHPAAARNPDPVAGIDGAAAKESFGRYQDSFKAPRPTFDVLGGER